MRISSIARPDSPYGASVEAQDLDEVNRALVNPRFSSEEAAEANVTNAKEPLKFGHIPRMC